MILMVLSVELFLFMKIIDLLLFGLVKWILLKLEIRKVLFLLVMYNVGDSIYFFVNFVCVLIL